MRVCVRACVRACELLFFLFACASFLRRIRRTRAGEVARAHARTSARARTPRSYSINIYTERGKVPKVSYRQPARGKARRVRMVRRRGKRARWESDAGKARRVRKLPGAGSDEVGRLDGGLGERGRGKGVYRSGSI